MKTALCGFLFFFIVSTALIAQTPFARGEELFMQNRPQEALRFLESATAEDPSHVQAFLYLAVVYLQINRLEDAIATYRQILPRAGADTGRIAFNLANAYFQQGRHELARQYYSQAIAAQPTFAPAYLNRANAQIKSGELRGALADYEEYLSLEPGTSQRGEIVRLMAFLREEFAAEDRRRIMAEEAAQAAEERRRRILEEISESIQAAAGESRGVSAAAEGVQGYESEFELE